jgi:hypothetical protein
VSSHAAGVAMLVATVVAVWAARVYGLNSLPWLILVVAVYMVKDRLKAAGQAIGERWLDAHFWDRVMVLYDGETNRPIGRMMQSARFQDSRQAPAEVRAGREASLQGEGPRILLRDGATVLRYRTAIRLDRPSRERRSALIGYVRLITRFNFRYYLRLADEPTAVWRRLGPSGEPADTPARKVYHIDVMFRACDAALATNCDLASRYEKYRVVADRDGIVRMTKVVKG